MKKLLNWRICWRGLRDVLPTVFFVVSCADSVFGEPVCPLATNQQRL